MEERQSRKLAVILHADVVGSTALVRCDEALAHERIRDAFQRFSQTIESYNGHALELRGDALVAEFHRASDAVAASLTFQAENSRFNASLQDNVRPTLRVGISLGEVVVADSTVTGEGIVLAQRLEQLAPGGGVCVQGAVYEAVPGRMPFDYEGLGEKTLKGISEPVRAYTVTIRPGESIPAPEAQRMVGKTRRGVSKKSSIAGGAIVILLLIGGGLSWLRPWIPGEESASIGSTDFPMPDKPSIVVLPFTNMSNDSDQEYFVDGISEDLITDLSKISGLFVIARNSSFTYKGKVVDVKEVGRELGVRYVLEGSVRRAADQVRINAQLIDATTGGHLWAERYDGSLANVFALQDAVTDSIVTALAVTLTAKESDRQTRHRTSSPEAYDAFLQGWAQYQLHTPDSLAKAVPHFEKAIQLDPEYTHAHAALAAIYWESWKNGWVDSLDISFFRASNEAKARLALAMANPTPLAHWVASNVLASQGKYEDAVLEAQQALALDPNNATGYAALANALIYSGNAASGIEEIRTAMRLDPLYPANYLVTLGQAEFALGRFEEAAATLERAVSRNPENEWGWLYLAATNGHLGRTDEAQTAVETFNELRWQRGLGELSSENVEHGRFARKADRDRLRAGLAKVPEPDWQSLITRGPEGYEVRGFSSIDAARAKKLYEGGALFVNVVGRDRDWLEGRIPGSVWLKSYLASQARFRELIDKDREVVFYGFGRANLGTAQSVAKAITWGYKNVHYFRGGTPEWQAAGYPIEKDE